MSVEVRDLHDIQYRGLCELLYPRLGDYARFLPNRLHQISMGHKHRVVLSASKVEITILQGWDLSQLASNYVYPLRDVHGDQSLLEVSWNDVAVHRTSQRQDLIW
jgi:hypothetical protein